MLTHSESIDLIAAALARAQARYLPLGEKRSANIQLRSGSSFKYDYADLADSFDAVRAALCEEHIAIVQGVSLVEEHVFVVTMLVHDSGQWFRDGLAMPVADIHDARAVGSAATYAKRYGVQSMTGVAPRGEDEDAEVARGGNHEMTTPRNPKLEVVPSPAPPARPGWTARVCPFCGKDTIIKGRAEFGGGWVCYTKKGGCGYKWPEGPHPSELPPAVKPGTVPMAEAEREAEKLFPDDASSPLEPLHTALNAEIERLVRRVQERFRVLPMSEAIRRKFWAEHVGPGVEFETAKGASLDGLWSLLNALGVQR